MLRCYYSIKLHLVFCFCFLVICIYEYEFGFNSNRMEWRSVAIFPIDLLLPMVHYITVFPGDSNTVLCDSNSRITALPNIPLINDLKTKYGNTATLQLPTSCTKEAAYECAYNISSSSYYDFHLIRIWHARINLQ